MDDYVLTEHVSVLVCISIGYVNVTVYIYVLQYLQYAVGNHSL